jgi:hypothetical protein
MKLSNGQDALLSLAISETQPGKASVAMRLTPLNEDLQPVHEEAKPVVFLDVFSSNDEDAKEAAQAISGIIQSYINKKGV